MDDANETADADAAGRVGDRHHSQDHDRTDDHDHGRTDDHDHGRTDDHDHDHGRTDDGDTLADGGPVVALDTSFLMAPVEWELRPFEELERVVPGVRPVVPESVVRELERLAGGAGEEATAASVGLELAGRVGTVATAAGDADDALVALAAADRVAYVATLDADLRDRVLARDVPVICLRGERELTVTRS